MAFNNIKSHKKTSFRLLRVKQLSEFDYLGRSKTVIKNQEREVFVTWQTKSLEYDRNLIPFYVFLEISLADFSKYQHFKNIRTSPDPEKL